jgi:hypothetical protein
MNILFGKKRSQKPLKPSHHISKSFAQDLLDLEVEVNLNCNLEKVRKLMELYSKAIEFYEENKNPMYTYYNEKIQNLLARDDVVSILNNSCTGKSNQTNTFVLNNPKNLEVSDKTPVAPSLEPNLVLKSSISDKSIGNQNTLKKNEDKVIVSNLIPVLSQEKILSNEKSLEDDKKGQARKNSMTSLPLQRTCNKVLDSHTIETSTVSKKILQNLKNQSDSLANRLESRKNAKLTRRQSDIVPKETNQSDKSGGEAKITPIELFEEEMERIMERYVEDKTSAKKEIEEKYKEYLSEFQSMEGDIMQSLVKELYKNMNEEIDARVKDLEIKRAQAIAQAKKNLANSC